MDRYIPDPTSWIFTGDNRPAQYNGGTFKSQQMFDGYGLSECEAGVSTIVAIGISHKGSVGRCDAVQTALPLGGRKVKLSTTATHGLIPIAPPIQTSMTIIEGPNGEIDVKVSGTPYPSVEVWQYGGPNGPQLIYHHVAQGGPSSLYGPGPLPPWSPTLPP